MITQEQREQWDRDGYIIVPNALDAIGLDRVRAAYERVEADQAPAWRESVLKGTYSGGYGNGPDAHTMNGIYEYDDVFLDLAANPITTPIIEDVIGQNFQVMEMICHNHHGNTNAHTGWHRDWRWSLPDARPARQGSSDPAGVRRLAARRAQFPFHWCPVRICCPMIHHATSTLAKH